MTMYHLIKLSSGNIYITTTDKKGVTRLTNCIIARDKKARWKIPINTIVQIKWFSSESILFFSEDKQEIIARAALEAL